MYVCHIHTYQDGDKEKEEQTDTASLVPEVSYVVNTVKNGARKKITVY